MISLVTICHHTNYYWLFPNYTFHTRDSFILQLEVWASWSPSLPFLPTPFSPLAAACLFFESMNLFCLVLFICFVFSILLITEIILYLSFSVWLISVNVTPSGPIHVVTSGKISFFFYVSVLLHCVSVCHIFIRSSISRYLGCFHILAIVTNVAAFQISILTFFR